MQERGLTATRLAATMGETIGMMNTALSRGISSLSGIERFAHGLRVPVWEMLYAAPVAAMGHELPEWDGELTGGVTLRLEELMQESGLTQAQLAERMDANRPNVNRWLRSRNLTLPTLQLFADALGVSDRLYLLFITQEEYDKEMSRRGYIDPARLAEENERIRRAEQRMAPFTEYPRTVTGDLFEQMDAAEHGPALLSDGEYRYAGMIISLHNGQVVTRVAE